MAPSRKRPGPPLAHMVFFSLRDRSPLARAALVAACGEYLSGHPGLLSFSAGERAADCNREVNDARFDVALHLVFRNKAAHDRYQDSKRHLQFIDQNAANWKKVRVFESYVGA